jgi:hypothetical protein
MLLYWIIFAIPAIAALSIDGGGRNKRIPIFLFSLFLTIVIGYRDEVGCDWPNYVEHFQNVVGLSLKESLERLKDPAHAVVNWLVAEWDGDIYLVNLIYASLFVAGLHSFVLKQPKAWLGMAVAVPYMVVMVSMGYSRQSVALGLFMLAITQIQKGSFSKYLFWVFSAALFHKSALLLLPFGLFLSKRGLLFRLMIMVPVLYGGWEVLLAQKQEHLWNTYVVQQMESAGAKIRVAMNLVPSLIFFYYRKKWKKLYPDYPFWLWVSLGSLASVALVPLATTAVDRVALYFIPVQIVVYSRLPVLAKSQLPPITTTSAILLAYGAVLFVWLNFASHAGCWIPYRNALAE